MGKFDDKEKLETIFQRSLLYGRWRRKCGRFPVIASLKGLLNHFQEYVRGRCSRSFADEMLYLTGWGICGMNYGIGGAVAPFNEASWCSGLERMGEDEALRDLLEWRDRWEYSTDSPDEDTSDEDTWDEDTSDEDSSDDDF
jgi:hypothetical protein